MTNRGIVIANTGSPDAPKPEAVKSYLADFLSDPRIRPMNPLFWNLILKAFILPNRSKKSAEKYKRIWTKNGSPLNVKMESLAKKVQESLEEENDSTLVLHAMSYGSPSLRDAFLKLEEQGCKHLTVVSLYPQSAYSTMKVVEDKTCQTLKDLQWKPDLTFIPHYSQRKEYRDAIAKSVEDVGFDAEKDFLLMAFHSIPMKDIDSGDTYANQVFESATAIAEKLNVRKDLWAIGFQCRFDKSRKWLGPSTRKIVSNLKKPEGRLFVVAPNFSIDCLETLYDIELTLRQECSTINPALQDTEMIYVPCLNDSDAHVRLIKALVQNNT